MTQTYISHISALVFLVSLVTLFAKWLTSKRTYIILFYCVSLSLVCVNLIVSMTFLELHFSNVSSFNVRPLLIVTYVISLAGSPFTELLSGAFDFLSLSSFLFMWVATAILLSQYRFRMGNVKYFSIMCIPLIYYIFPFQAYFGELLFPLLISSPAFFSVTYVLLFSATKQAGAVLFGLTFWFASGLVFDSRIRKSLLISSIGMAILFGSIEISPLQYSVYPPYGLMTQAFIPMGAYLLLIGIFTSALHISRDAALRREFYRSASSQLSLLKTIGVSEMEKELEGRVKYLERRHRLSRGEVQPEVGEQADFENAKKILDDVLKELYSSKTKSEGPNQ